MGLAWTEFNLSTWGVPSTVVANAMVSHASWRIMFYLCIGYGAFSLVGTALVYFPPSHPRPDGKTKWQKFKELDFVAAFLFAAGLVIFLYGLNSGGTTYAWSAAGTIAPLVLGLLTFVSAFVYDAFVPTDPLFPWYLFKNFRGFSALIVLVFVAGMVFFAASALNAQTILYLHTADPIKIGLYSLPSGYVAHPFFLHSPEMLIFLSHRVGQLIGGCLIPALVHYIKHVHYQLTFAVAMQTLFFGLAALITPTNLNWLMAVQFLAMFPFGWITLNCYTTASLNVPQRDLGVAIGLIGTFRSVGGSIGSVLFSTIFEQTAEKEVAKRVAATAAERGVVGQAVGEVMEAVALTLVGVPGQAARLSGASVEVFETCVRAARYAYAYAFRVTWLASIPFGVVALLAAIAVRDPSRHFTDHVEVRLEKKRGAGKKMES